MAAKKKAKLTKAEYVDAFIARMKELDPKIIFDQAEEWAFNAWALHSRENFQHYETPKKDAEYEFMWQVNPPEL